MIKNKAQKVIIVVYYWPPSGGIAVQRWLRMVAYFVDEGWEPVIVCPAGADYPIIDERTELLVPEGVEVIRIPIWEVRNFYKKLLRVDEQKGVKADDLFFTDFKKLSWKQKLALWIRGNIFIPDARVTWVRPVTKFLTDYLLTDEIDAIITTGPPHSVHLIGQNIKRKFPNIFWLADFRDPWTEIEYHDKMLLNNWAKNRHTNLESLVVKSCDMVTTVSPSWTADFKAKGAKKVEIVINGFDELDFKGKVEENRDKFTLCHAGTMVGDRWVETFWNCLRELISEDDDLAKDLQIRIVGRTDESILDGFKRLGLTNYVVNLGIRSHEEAILEMRNSTVLLLIINQAEGNSKGRLTGKIYEYIAAQKPILLIGPKEGDAYKLIESDDFGLGAEYEDKVTIKTNLEKMYRDWKSERSKGEERSIYHFSRAHAANQVMKILNREVRE